MSSTGTINDETTKKNKLTFYIANDILFIRKVVYYMDEKFVSYIAFESSLAREERTIKRLTVLLVLLIFCWLATIGIFIWYITLPIEEVTTSQSIDADDSENIYQSI